MEKDLKLDLTKKEAFDNLNKLIAEFKLESSQKEVEGVNQIRQITKWALFDDDRAHPNKEAKLAKQQEEGFEKVNTDYGDKRDKEELMKTQEEVIKLHKMVKQQRCLWMLKNQALKLKYEDELEILRKKLTSNHALWEQLEESDKRNKILQQELIFTQKSLSQCEKIIDKLKDELKMSE